MNLQKIFTGKNIKTRVLLINWRQVLGLDQNGGVMINRATILKIQTRLQASHGKKRVVSRVIDKECLNGTRNSFRLEKWIGAVSLQIEVCPDLIHIIHQNIVHRHIIGS